MFSCYQLPITISANNVQSTLKQTNKKKYFILKMQGFYIIFVGGKIILLVLIGFPWQMLEAQEEKCPEYTCEQRHIPDGKCNVTGRTFDTFDGTEYKYDICDHVLAQDMISSQWQIKCKF